MTSDSRRRRRRRWALALGTLTLAWLLAGTGTPGRLEGNPWLRQGLEARPLVIAHGGGLAWAPANTLAALRLAAATGVDVLEFDVQLSADGALVLMHDSTVDRTTDGTGPVIAQTLSTLQGLNAAAHFVGPRGQAHPFEPVPSLEAVLRAFAGSPLRFVIELKNDGEGGAQAARVLAEALRRHHLEDRTIVGSFHRETLEAFRNAARGRVATSGAPSEVAPLVLLPLLGLAGAAFEPGPVSILQVPVAAGPLRLAHPRRIAQAQALGLAVQFWTVNDEAAMEALAKDGADGIMTDDVPKLRAVLQEAGYGLPDPWPPRP